MSLRFLQGEPSNPPSRASHGSRGVTLAGVPFVTAVLVWAFAMPRAVAPMELPLPQVDGAALAEQVARDHGLAKDARLQPLPTQVRALGTAIRAFNAAEVRDEEPAVLSQRRSTLEGSVGPALERDGVGALVRLRAVQMDEFLAEVSRFERTGMRTQELDELGGTFVRSLMRVGWVHPVGGAVAVWPPTGSAMLVILDDAERRAMFKLTWNKLVGLGARSELALSLDENRALYSFYLRHPHAPESQRMAMAAARRQAKDADTCARIDEGERVAALGWVMTKMKELSTFDPAYPLAYARGVALFHRHEYGPSAEQFRAWLGEHPEGAWTLRARNYLAAAAQAGNVL